MVKLKIRKGSTAPRQMKEETREKSEEKTLRHTRSVKQPNSRKAKENNQANKIKKEKISTTNQTIFTAKTRHKNRQIRKHIHTKMRQ
jgi:hypothetical protein